MNKQEALVYLNIDDFDEDNLKDHYQQTIYNYVIQVYQKAIIPKLWLKKLEKINKDALAFKTLGLSRKVEIKSNNYDFIKAESITTHLNNYFSSRNKLYKDLFQIKSFENLELIIKTLLNLHQQFAQAFIINDEIVEYSDVILAKQLDDQAFLNSVKTLSEKGVNYFNEIKKNINTLPNELLVEMKRLTLLYNG